MAGLVHLPKQNLKGHLGQDVLKAPCKRLVMIRTIEARPVLPGRASMVNYVSSLVRSSFQSG